MAIPYTAVWEIRTTGNDTNGGGFDSSAAGTDMSVFDNKNSSGGTNCQSTTNNLSVTDLSTTTTGAFTATSLTAAFTSAITGNIVYLTGGGVTAGWYRVTYRSATQIDLDRSPGAVASGVTINIGGALASLGVLHNICVMGNIIYVKAGTYTVTTATIGGSGGCFGAVGYSRVLVVGYTTNRNVFNRDAQPVIQLAAGVSSATMFYVVTCLNLTLDGTNQTSSRGFQCQAIRCVARNFTNSACNGLAIYCEASGCSQNTVFSGAVNIGCVAHGNSVQCFYQSTCIECIAYANTSTPFRAVFAKRCIAYGNTGASTSGFGYDAGSYLILIDCITISNGQYAYYISTVNPLTYQCAVMINCATYNNPSGKVAAGTQINELGVIALTGDPFVNAAGQDFTLNSTAGAGAALKAAGWQNPFVGISANMLNYSDIGPIQHQDAGGGTTNLFVLLD